MIYKELAINVALARVTLAPCMDCSLLRSSWPHSYGQPTAEVLLACERSHVAYAE